PDVLVLDEATSALDGATEAAVLDTIHTLAHTKTLLVIAHRLTTVRPCDVIHVVEAGRVVASGSWDDLVASSERFQALGGR
ncbi:MAG: ABC transporter ATP-binding protein, partial [Gemmatimonadetes bacterium]|nr:ABC transporter ATP-binding protein [Gemmatimonadota bacterium]